MEGPRHPVVIHAASRAVTATDLDGNGHVNNVVYLGWVQEIAADHAERSGCAAATRDAGGMWVVREHRIEYLAPALLGQRVTLRTWIATMGRVRSLRRTEIVDLDDGRLLVRASTDWAFVDRATGRPKAIPSDVTACFTLRTDEEGGSTRRSGRRR